jgi:outer membrane receptor protein involved in Fe transport
MITGGGMYRTENDTDFTFQAPIPICLTRRCLSNYNTDQYFGYLYSNYTLFDNLDVTAGLSFDHYRGKQSVAQAKVNELNPKFGLLWRATDFLTFRGAVFKSVKSAIVDNQMLQPTQIVGFNQFFDDLNGTAAWQYGVGMDAHLHNNLYAGVEAYKRDLKIPQGINDYEKTKEELYRLYVNWTPMANLAINSGFRFENFRYDNENNTGYFPSSVETAFIPLEIRFFYPVGFFAELKGTYINQKVRAIADYGGNFNSSFYLVDTAIGYRFPKQYGLISFEAKNLFDTHFKYRDRQFQMNEQRSPDIFPERMLFARITFNF